MAYDVNFVRWSAAWGWDNPVNANQKMALSVARQRSRQGKRERTFKARFQVWGEAEAGAGRASGRGGLTPQTSRLRKRRSHGH